MTETTSDQGYSVLKRRDYSSTPKVFAELLPREFLAPILDTLRQNDTGVFSASRGKRCPNYFSGNRGCLCNFQFACRAWIHGRGAHAGMSVVNAYKNALNFHSQYSEVRLNGFRKTDLIHRRAYIGRDQAKNLNRFFQGLSEKCFAEMKSCFDLQASWYRTQCREQACSSGNMALSGGCSASYQRTFPRLHKHPRHNPQVGPSYSNFEHRSRMECYFPPTLDLVHGFLPLGRGRPYRSGEQRHSIHRCSQA